MMHLKQHAKGTNLTPSTQKILPVWICSYIVYILEAAQWPFFFLSFLFVLSEYYMPGVTAERIM